MAHTCPECGMLCYCCGDIDDLDFGERSFCKHYLSENCDYNRDDEDDFYDPDDYDLPMNWQPYYNAPDEAEKRHFAAEQQKLK